MSTLSRRTFLKLTAFGATAATMAACTAPAAPAPAPKATEAPKPAAPPAAAQVTAAPKPTEAPKAAAPTAAPAKPSGYAEAPALADLVKAGKLPPVEQRLPAQPLVLDPVAEIGQYGGTLRLADTTDVGGLTMMAIGVEPFTKHTRDLKTERPNVIESWEYNPDATEITLRFRKGLKWSDGQPVTVDDYLFWWNDMVLDQDIKVAPPTEVYPDGKHMTATKVDDATLKLKFPVGQPTFLELHGMNYGKSAQFVTPAHYLKKFHPKHNKEMKDNKELLDRYNNRWKYPDYPVFTAWKPVEYVAGQRGVFERNPYYWKVDTKGNQLPYIDRVEVTVVKDAQVMLLKAISGELDAQVRDFNIKDVPVLKENEAKGNYRVVMLDRGDIAWPWIMIQYDYKDAGIVDLFYKKEFRRALSVAMNRQRMNDIVWLGLGKARQPAMLPSNPEFQLPDGKKIYDGYANSYTQYDVAQAKKWLDEAGVVDKDNDGWRERPDGSKLELIIDVPVTDKPSVETCDFIKEDWEKVGLKTTINATDGTVVNQRTTNQEQMLRAWGSAGSDWLFTAPPVWTPIYNTVWSIGGQTIGQYYETGGQKGTAPRPGSALDKLQKIYTEAKQLTTREARFKKVLEGYQVHVDEGPITIGTIGEHVSPAVVKNNLRNFSEFAIVASWNMGFPGTGDPEQWYFKK